MCWSESGVELGEVSLYGSRRDNIGPQNFSLRYWGGQSKNWCYREVTTTSKCKGYHEFSWTCRSLLEVHQRLLQNWQTIEQLAEQGCSLQAWWWMSRSLSDFERKACISPNNDCTWLEQGVRANVWCQWFCCGWGSRIAARQDIPRHILC